MNKITVKKTITSLLASICLLICLIHMPDPTHLDQGQIIEQTHSQNIVENEHYSSLLENNYVFINQRKRTLEKRLINGFFSN